MTDGSTRWAQLFIRCAIAVLGTYIAAAQAGAHGIAAWGPSIVAGLTTLEAGLSKSPGGPVQMQMVQPAAPMPVSGPSGPTDPVNVEVAK